MIFVYLLNSEFARGIMISVLHDPNRPNYLTVKQLQYACPISVSQYCCKLFNLSHQITDLSEVMSTDISYTCIIRQIQCYFCQNYYINLHSMCYNCNLTYLREISMLILHTCFVGNPILNAADFSNSLLLNLDPQFMFVPQHDQGWAITYLQYSFTLVYLPRHYTKTIPAFCTFYM